MADTGYKRRGGRYADLCTFYGRIGSPRRVVSGLLTVIVRNAIQLHKTLFRGNMVGIDSLELVLKKQLVIMIVFYIILLLL